MLHELSRGFKGNTGYTQVRETAYNTSLEFYLTALGGKPGAKKCLCPAHDDTRPSLSITQGRKTIVFRCRAGCSQEAIINAIRRRGLPWPPSRNAIHHHSEWTEKWDE